MDPDYGPDDGQIWRRLGAVFLVVIVVLGAALMTMGTQVSSILSTVGASIPAGGGTVVEPDPGGGEEPGEEPDGGSGGEGIPLYSVDRADLLIIKTGSLTLQVAAVDTALAQATDVITALDGYASGSDRAGNSGSDEASITFRIPAAAWDEAFSRLRALGEKVLHEHSATEDVTAQVVDLGARITNLRATEAALQEIMARAGVIKDVLDVQRELTDVRGEIEQLSAQERHLREQAVMSTLTVRFALRPESPVVVEQQGFDPGVEVEEASATLVGVLQEVATAGIWFGIVWLPILLVLSILVGIGVVAARRVRRPVAEVRA